MAKIILLVEDDYDIALMEKRALEHMHEVKVLTDFGLALVSETWEGIDVGIIDLMLPGVSGADILSYLSINYPDIKRILVTAMVNVTEEIQAMAHVVLFKPYSLKELRTAVGF